MAGVNLSQSMASRESAPTKRPFAASGFPLSIILLILTAAGWGGLRWYLHTLDQKIAGLDATLSASSGQLQGKEIDRVADFDARLSLLGVDASERLDSREILTKLEALIVPQVVLKEFKYDQKEKMSVMTGETDNFRYLAGQLVSLKSDPLFSRVVVSTVSRTQEGKIQFTLKASF